MPKRRPSGDGTIRKRADGRWEGRIVVGHGEGGKPIFRSVFAKTQRELLPKLKQLKDRYDGITLTAESNLTLGAWLGRWLTEYKKPMLRPSTYRGYEKYCEDYIRPHLGNMLIGQITTADIQKMYNALSDHGRVIAHPTLGLRLSPSMVHSIHSMLHGAMDAAVREGLILTNPTKGTALPKPEKQEATVLSEEQVATFLAAIEKEPIWRDFFYTAILTGMRRGEICGLKWEDFDADTGKLHIRRSVHFEDGKMWIGETKTNEGNRKIVLPPSVVACLVNRKQTAESEWIFPTPWKPNEPMNCQVAYKQLKRILGEAGLPSIRFHDLRHTFATHAATSGVDPKTLAGMLGHTKASFTLDIYTHVTTDTQKRASQVVESYITDMFGEELKPWQKNARKTQAQ